MNLQSRPVAAAIHHQRLAWLAAGVLVVGMALSAGHARAESNFVNGAGTANAKLNFTIIIPKFLYLQVGTGTYPTTVATVDTVTFDMSAAIASIGNGTAQAGTGGDGTGPGTVTARVVGNNFTAATNLSATTTGPLSNGTSTISWSEIIVATPTRATVVPAAASVLNHPGTTAAPFTDGGATTVSLTPVASTRVINQAGKWAFSYKNTNVPSSGTYGGAANGGQVTYSIAMP